MAGSPIQVFHFSSLSFLICFASFLVHATRIVNITLDDSSSRFTYLPSGGWVVGTNCTGCTAHPDTADLYNGTWHDSTFDVTSEDGAISDPNVPKNATVTFNGFAIYVYVALALTTSDPTGNSVMTFYIDDVQRGTYYKVAPGENGYEYHVCVFSYDSLSLGDHTLLIQNGLVNGNKSLVLLDYIIYSQPELNPFRVEPYPNLLSPSNGNSTSPGMSSVHNLQTMGNTYSLHPTSDNVGNSTSMEGSTSLPYAMSTMYDGRTAYDGPGRTADERRTFDPVAEASISGFADVPFRARNVSVIPPHLHVTNESVNSSIGGSSVSRPSAVISSNQASAVPSKSQISGLSRAVEAVEENPPAYAP
ncbi:hypothetical protein FISHEDRAFT_69111 [Fistulina hepatica ATCC 64428]|uniref:Uncharacterized protein n=1 Tax=Fistulina hepatica ATCC 64428 TaxID=1128425 RepID=A0A0D7AR34_9AGAR|nr:hypothetical protein FISHEDRAFT_69111 [Fistulina hepatica ATCC 64428]